MKGEYAQALKIAEDFLATTEVTDVYEKARRRANIRVEHIDKLLKRTHDSKSDNTLVVT